MQEWLKITLLLCFFGTLREIRPSEPFVSEFFLGWHNVTSTQLDREIYPVGIYSYTSLLVLVFLITDFLRFKPVIILSGLSGISVYAVLLWTSGMGWLKASQFLYGLYMATEVAYLTYIYAKVASDKYPAVSSYTRIAALTGRFLSGVSAQLLTHFGLMDYRDLNYITFTAQILATFWALWLPPVPYGIYFHRRSIVSTLQVKEQSPDKHVDVTQRPFTKNVTEAVKLIARHSRAAYSRPKVIAWSALYAVSLTLFYQVQYFVQLLWEDINKESSTQASQNGAVEAALTLLGAGGALVASHASAAVLPAPTMAVQGAAVFLAVYPRNIYASYVGYIAMGMLFHYIITLASAKIASQLSDESCFGLIFGINTLIGTGLQSLLTFILLQKLNLTLTSMFFTISGMYLLVAVCWLIGIIINMFRQKHSICNIQY